MIDTVRFDQSRALRPEHKKSLGGIILIHRPSKLRGFCNGQGFLTGFEVCLPKILHGTNGKLLKSQSEVHSAFEKMEQMISRFAFPSTEPRNFTRVDLVWQFLKSPSVFFLSHRDCNHPEINKKVSAFRGRQRSTGLEWQGSRMKIKMYDKTDRKLTNTASIVRVEVQLRTSKLREKFGQSSVVNLDFAQCYKVYRSIVVQFQPENAPIVKGKDEVLCHANSMGVPVLQLLEPSVHDKTLRALRKKINTHEFQSHGINWHLLLPPNHPPRAYEVGPRPKIRFRKVTLHP